MKSIIRFISAGVLVLVVGTVAPAHARQEQHPQETNLPKQEHPAKPEKVQRQAKQQQDQNRQRQQQDQNKQQQLRSQQQQLRAQQQQQRTQQQPQDQYRQQRVQQQQAKRPLPQGRRVQRGEQRTVWQQQRARSWESEHRTWQQRGGYNGYRIPQDRYRRYFGQQHRFRIYRYPTVLIGGYPRFQYGGFWFGLVDPWPEYWADNWYDNDDVYIDYYEDGYYLYNPRYPQDRIAITVYLR